MTTINKIAITGVAVFLAFAFLGLTPVSASEVTGTLSAGAAAPAGGSTAGGSIGGGVGGGSSISGSVSGGTSGGGSGGSNNNSGSVLSANTVNSGSVLAAASFPGLPNTGAGGLAGLAPSTLNYLIFALTFGILLVDRKQKAGPLE